MRLLINIFISLVIAAIATAAMSWYTADAHGTLFLFLGYGGATLATALAISLLERSGSAQQKASKTRVSKKPARTGPADQSSTGDAPRELGEVKWFNVSKGYGFITKDDGEEIFVHFRSIKGGGRRGLKDGQRVSFTVAQSDKGPQAENVESAS